MKLKATLLAITLAAFAVSATYAVEEHHDAPQAVTPKAEKQEAAAAAQGEAKMPVKKPVKKHSHMEEKTNMPMNAPAPNMGKEMPKDRHDHMKEKH